MLDSLLAVALLLNKWCTSGDVRLFSYSIVWGNRVFSVVSQPSMCVAATFRTRATALRV
jgi:hypothetical protein